MIEFSPKARFQKNQEARDAWARLAHEPLLLTVVNDALAEMAWRRECNNPEQLVGAKNFISILLNMAEPPAPVPEYPIKALKSYDNIPPIP
jgi:hypothetical protein